MARSSRVGAYVVCVRDGQVLLARWVGKGKPMWTLPGGGIDHGEDPLDAAVREVAEETGYQVEVEALLGIDSIRRVTPRRLRKRPSDWHGLRIVYAGRVVGGDLRFEVGGSTDMAAWFDLAEVSSLDRVTLVDTALELARVRPPVGRV